MMTVMMISLENIPPNPSSMTLALDQASRNPKTPIP